MTVFYYGPDRSMYNSDIVVYKPTDLTGLITHGLRPVGVTSSCLDIVQARRKVIVCAPVVGEI